MKPFLSNRSMIAFVILWFNHSMRKYISASIAMVILFSGIASCKKDPSCEGCASKSNKPPIAVAGIDHVITLPSDSVLLDGRASNDPDGSITSYLWTKISGPASFNILKPTDSVAKIKTLVVGTYLFELKVTDNGGLSAKDTVQVSTLKINALPDQSVICVNNRPEVAAQLIPFGTLSVAKEFASVAFAGNKIVFAGGFESVGSGSTESSRVDIYDLSLQKWSIASLSSRRVNAAVAVNGNQIFFAGGGYFYGDYYSNVDIYDASSNSWAMTSLSVPKTGVAGAAVGSKVMFAGGFKVSGDYLPGNIENLVETYESSTSNWQTASLSEARGFISAVTANQRVYFAGGSLTTLSNKIDIYDYATNSWSASTLSFLSTARGAIAAGNKIYWTDGSCQVEIRNINTGVSNLEYLSRSGETISVLKNDKIVFIRTGSIYFDIYNTTTNEWSVGILSQPILHGSCAISVNNTIYIAGGVTHCQPTGTTGICSPVLTNQVYKLEF